MASKQTAKTTDEAPTEFEELVSPDGSRKQTPTTQTEYNRLRFDGYLPEEQQKQEAPAPRDSGSSTLTGNEKTVGSAPA